MLDPAVVIKTPKIRGKTYGGYKTVPFSNTNETPGPRARENPTYEIPQRVCSWYALKNMVVIDIVVMFST